MQSDSFFALAAIANRAQQAMRCQHDPLACCFERALHMLIAMRTLPQQTPGDGRWRLCHGTATIRVAPRKTAVALYAWLENEGVVFDPLAGKLYPKSDYYTVGHINPDQVITYTVKTAQKAMIEHAGTDWENGPFAAHFINAIEYEDCPIETDAQPDALTRLPGLVVGTPTRAQATDLWRG